MLVRVNYNKTYQNKSDNDEVIFIEEGDMILKIEEEAVTDKYYRAAQLLKEKVSCRFRGNKRLVIIMPSKVRGFYINTLYKLEELIDVKIIEVITDIPPPGY